MLFKLKEINLKKNLCTYFLLCWIFIAVCGLSLVAACEGSFLVAVLRLSLAVAALILGCAYSGSVAVAHGL